MNEHEEPKLTSRRARRMQEQLETTGIPVVSDEVAPEMPDAPENPAETSPGVGDIDISPVDADGRPRTRRELRELREAALASRDVASVPEPTLEPDLQEGVEPVADAEPAAELVVEGLPAPEFEPVPEEGLEAEQFTIAAVDPAEFDDRLAQTEAMSFSDLIEVASAGATSTDEADADADTDIESEADASPEAEDVASVPAKGRFRLPWGRSKDGAAGSDSEPEPELGSEAADEVSATEPPATDEDAQLAEDGQLVEDAQLVADASDRSSLAGEGVLESAPESSAPTGPTLWVPDTDDESADDLNDPNVEPVASESAPAEAAEMDADEDEEDGEVVDAPAPASARTSYSFPDIAPLEEERSIFDDPATREMSALPSDSLASPPTERTGDFDDLISRAIAAEGASSSNTAALILPSMPEGTGLAGPLGETGELFVTGSIELPKSLGETGGHARLHDSIEFDPLADLGIDLREEPVPDDSAPVSATRAISARTVEGSGVVAPHTKKGNRLPLILSLTAGALLLAVIGLLAWGASNGMFG